MKAYLLNNLVALSQLGNTLLAGKPDETMSSRAWRTSQQGRWPGVVTRPLIDACFLVITLGRDRDHCRKSWESERDRKQFPDSLRGSP